MIEETEKEVAKEDFGSIERAFAMTSKIVEEEKYQVSESEEDAMTFENVNEIYSNQQLLK